MFANHPQGFLAVVFSSLVGSRIMAGPALKFLVEKNNVDDRTTDWLANHGCVKVENLANWVGSRDQMKDNILEKISALEDDDAQLARLRMAWR